MDVGQRVTTQDPHAKDVLVRDVTRLVQWINRLGYNEDIGECLLRVLEDPVPTLPSLSDGN